MKRILVLADLHCGHRAALTPPDFQYKTGKDKTRDKYARFQQAEWKWFSSELKALQPIDLCVCNGDAIDGKGERTGGSEQIEEDRKRQSEMAELCIRETGAKEFLLTYGTAYHAGKEEDWEAIIAKSIGCEVKSHLFVDAFGVIFDFKHKISGSTIPHGRHTASQRERLWNLLWAERDLQPKSQISVRSHVHYFGFSGDSRGVAFTTPALQGPGSKYGARQCSGTIDVGFLVFNVDSDRSYSWMFHEFDYSLAAEKAVKI